MGWNGSKAEVLEDVVSDNNRCKGNMLKCGALWTVRARPLSGRAVALRVEPLRVSPLRAAIPRAMRSGRLCRRSLEAARSRGRGSRPFFLHAARERVRLTN